MTIGEKIKFLRAERALTQTELAGDHITRNMLSLIESGSAQPSLATILYLAEKLKVPTGYLLADDNEEFIYKKHMNLAKLHKALDNKEFSICRELCLDIMGEREDGELMLILAECSLGIAKEYFFAGKLRSACREFETACDYADNTVYNTSRIKAEAGVFCSYMQNVSQTLFAECSVESSRRGLSVEEDFCRYALALEAFENGNLDLANEYAGSGDFLSRHIHAKINMKNGDFISAHAELIKILNEDANVCGAVMYDAFRELEQCCREIGDFKGAYEYSNAKVLMLERLLAEEI